MCPAFIGIAWMNSPERPTSSLPLRRNSSGTIDWQAWGENLKSASLGLEGTSEPEWKSVQCRLNSYCPYCLKKLTLLACSTPPVKTNSDSSWTSTESSCPIGRKPSTAPTTPTPQVSQP